MKENRGTQSPALEAKPTCDAANHRGREHGPQVDHVHHAEDQPLGSDPQTKTPPSDQRRLDDAAERSSSKMAAPSTP